MQIQKHLLISTAIIALFAAQTQARNVYVNLLGGANGLSDELNFSPVESSDLGGNWEFNTGWDAGGAVGMAFMGGPRIEGEVVFRRNSADKHFDEDDAVNRSAHGDVSRVSVMLNAAYDFDCGSLWTPYVGIGAGAVRVSYKIGSLDEDLDDYGINDSYWKGAVQGFAGVDYPIAPSFRLGVRYNFLTVQNPQEHLNSFVNGSPLSWSKTDDVNEHTAFVTLRYNFMPE